MSLGQTLTLDLRHIQMRENCVRENIQTKFITVDHVGGKINLSDMFTKEEQHQQHFLTTRDKIMSITPSETIPASTINSPITNNTSTNNNSPSVLPDTVSTSKDLSLSESLPTAQLSQILPEKCTTSQVPLGVRSLWFGHGELRIMVHFYTFFDFIKIVILCRTK